MLREAELPGAFRTRGKPNWVVTTLSGEIKEVFFGPKKKFVVESGLRLFPEFLKSGILSFSSLEYPQRLRRLNIIVYYLSLYKF